MTPDKIIKGNVFRPSSKVNPPSHYYSLITLYGLEVVSYSKYFKSACSVQWTVLVSPRNAKSVQFSHSVMSDSLRPHELQHARPPCPSPTPRAYSNSCPSSQWYHPTISSSVIPVSSHLQSFPASGSFLKSQFLASGGQNIGTSTSASVLPMDI